MTTNALRDILQTLWSAETSSDPARWTPENPAYGQCAVTALIVRDLYKGAIVQAYVDLPNGDRVSHYFNHVLGAVVDLTASQFPEGTVIPEGKPRTGDSGEFETTREYLLSNVDTFGRYLALKSKLYQASRFHTGLRNFLPADPTQPWFKTEGTETGRIQCGVTGAANLVNAPRIEIEELQHRPKDWETATDEQILSALMEKKDFVNPFFVNWVRNHRPDVMRRYLNLHRDMGGTLGSYAREFLGQYFSPPVDWEGIERNRQTPLAEAMRQVSGTSLPDDTEMSVALEKTLAEARHLAGAEEALRKVLSVVIEQVEDCDICDRVFQIVSDALKAMEE
jgi:hypothetical protein